MITKILALAGACAVLLIGSLRFLASSSVHSGDGRRLHPRLGGPGGEGKGLTKTQAEDLLDWLEAHDVRDRQITYEPGKGFFVR